VQVFVHHGDMQAGSTDQRSHSGRPGADDGQLSLPHARLQHLTRHRRHVIAARTLVMMAIPASTAACRTHPAIGGEAGIGYLPGTQRVPILQYGLGLPLRVTLKVKCFGQQYQRWIPGTLQREHCLPSG
jgi:hypothetical protein